MIYTKLRHSGGIIIKKLLFVVAFAILISSAGCGSVTDSTANTTAPQRVVNLSIILDTYGRYKDQLDLYFAQFAAKELSEKNIKVTFNTEYPPDSNLLKTRLASGDKLDIYNLHAILDVQDFKKGGYLPDLTNAAFVPKLIPSIRQIVTIDNKVFGVPMESYTWSYLYNKDIFAKYNLTPPKTITEMKQVIKVLEHNDITPFVLPYNAADYLEWILQMGFEPLCVSTTPDWFDRMNAGNASLKELQNKGMFDIVDLVNTNGNKDALSVDNDQGLSRFAQGEGAMIVTGPWYASDILQYNSTFNLGLAALPVNDDSNATRVLLTVATIITYNPKTQNKDVCIDFLNYLLDDTDSSQLFDALKLNQVTTTQNVNLYPWTKEGLDYVNKSLYYINGYIPQAVHDQMGKDGQLYFMGKISQKQYIEDIDATWKKVVASSK